MRVIKLVYSNSKIGNFHRDKGLLNQDVIKFLENDDLAVAVLADGVSATKNGGKGAEITVLTVADFLIKNGKRFISFPKNVAKSLIIYEVQDALKQNAGECDIEDFASTLCFALLQKSTEKLMLFSLGDSGVYLLSEKGCVPFAVADKRDVRFTVSEDAGLFAKLETVAAGDCCGVMLCSDGAWRTMYSNGFMLQPLVNAAKAPDFKAFVEHFENSDSDDDSSVLLMSF